MEVHRHLGCGFLEPVYQEALELELETRKIPFAREVELPVFYKGQRLALRYRADFICFDQVLVELKAIARLTDREGSQVIDYSAGKQSGAQDKARLTDSAAPLQCRPPRLQQT